MAALAGPDQHSIAEEDTAGEDIVEADTAEVGTAEEGNAEDCKAGLDRAVEEGTAGSAGGILAAGWAGRAERHTHQVL